MLPLLELSRHNDNVKMNKTKKSAEYGLTSLQELVIEDGSIEILIDLYTDSSVTVHLHEDSDKSGSREA